MLDSLELTCNCQTLCRALTAWRQHFSESCGQTYDSTGRCCQFYHKITAGCPTRNWISHIPYIVANHGSIIFITACSELRNVLFLVPSGCGFFVCVWNISGNRWTDLRQIHTEDVFCPSLRRVWRSTSKVKVTREKMAFFGPFGGLACRWFRFGKTSLASSL